MFFTSPWLIGFLIFYLAPMIASLVFSTFNFTLSAPDEAKFVGLQNWSRMLFDDPNTWETLFVTLKFALSSLPIGMITAFMLAVLLNSKHLIGRNLFRTLFYAPTMVPLIAGILIWSAVLNPQTGWLNRVIEFFGIPAVGVHGLRWLDDPNLIYIAYTFIGLYGIGNSYADGSDFADDFHVYAIEWDPNVIRWYVDGNLYSVISVNELQNREWVYDHDFFIIMNIAIGGAWPGSPNDSTTFPQQMLVDYVRVYQLAP